MAISTRPPDAPVAPRLEAEAGHRGPRRLFATLVAVVIVVAVGAFVWLDEYQPLALGSGSYGLWPQSETVASFSAEGPDGNFQQTYVKWEVGRTIHMQFPLRNEGPIPVTI